MKHLKLLIFAFIVDDISEICLSGTTATDNTATFVLQMDSTLYMM